MLLMANLVERMGGKAVLIEFTYEFMMIYKNLSRILYSFSRIFLDFLGSSRICRIL